MSSRPTFDFNKLSKTHQIILSVIRNSSLDKKHFIPVEYITYGKKLFPWGINPT
jgi:hypothetical protein